MKKVSVFFYVGKTVHFAQAPQTHYVDSTKTCIKPIMQLTKMSLHTCHHELQIQLRLFCS